MKKKHDFYRLKTLQKKVGIKMFLANLSQSLLSFCHEEPCSQAVLAKRCGLSAKGLNKIICRHSDPKLSTLQSICAATHKTPSELLFSSIEQQLSYRIPIEVQSVYLGRDFCSSEFPGCPRCYRTLFRNFQPYCDHCGQQLSWTYFK